MKTAVIVAEPLMVDAEGACRAIGIGRSTLFELLRDGTLRRYKLGGKLLIDYQELKRFKETLQPEPVKPAKG